MNVVIKSTLRNIKSKPGRSIILILCVMLTSYVAIFAVAGRTMIEGMLEGIFKAMTGSIDFDANVTDMSAFDNCPEADICGYTGVASLVSNRDPENYYISYSDKIRVYNFSDYHVLYEMGQIGTEIEITGNEAYVSERYAKKYNVNIGDTITVYGATTSVSSEIVVTGFANIPATAPVAQNAIFVTPEVICILTERTEPNYFLYFVDVKDDSQIEAFKAQVMANDFKAKLTDVADGSLDGIESVTQIFIFLFLFTFLLVIFVTINFSEKIVNERMSFIGTLRSLGASRKKTSLILILENVFYGLAGSVLGVVIHATVVPILVKSAAVYEISADFGSINVIDYYVAPPAWVYVLVILGAMLVESLCPMFTLLKAVRTPIRDIIFQNKDTKYNYSWSRFYAGIVLVVVAIVCSFLRKSFVALCLCLTSSIVALAVLTPFILKGISILGEKFLSSDKTPLLNLAVKEVSNNKHMVATSVLCVTTIILSTCLNSFALSFLSEFNTVQDDYDVIIENTGMKDQYYSFIEDLDGVTGVDRYNASMGYECVVGGIEGEFTIICDTELDSIHSTSELTGELKYHEIAITRKLAERLNVDVGDTIDVELVRSLLFSCSYEATVAIIMDNYGYEEKAIAVSTGIYNHLENGDNELGEILIHCEEGKADTVRAQLLKYLTDSEEDISTKAMKVEAAANQNRKISAIIYGIVAMGVILTLIGTSGNQIIAFEGRRREIAVLYSVAMSKKQLRKLLLIESALSIGIGVVVSIILGKFLSSIFGDALFVVTNGDMPQIQYSIVSHLIYVGIIFVILMLTVCSPFRRLKKMNCAQELKYE